MTVLWRCLKTSGKEIGKASCDNRCKAGESIQCRSREASKLIRSEQFLNVSNFGDVLKDYREVGDLQSSLTLYMAADKLSQVLKEKRWSYIDFKGEERPDLIIFEKWPSRMGFQCFQLLKESKKSTKREKRLPKTMNFSASSNVKQNKQVQNYH